MFTDTLLGPDVITALHLVNRKRLPPSLSFLLSSFAHEIPSPAQFLLHYLNRNPPPSPLACAGCNSVSLLYTLGSVLGRSHSSKVTTGSGLVQANVNNPPPLCLKRQRQTEVEKWAARPLKSHLSSCCDKCGHRNSLDQSGGAARERERNNSSLV